jgi:hypothetical protein
MVPEGETIGFIFMMRKMAIPEIAQRPYQTEV